MEVSSCEEEEGEEEEEEVLLLLLVLFQVLSNCRKAPESHVAKDLQMRRIVTGMKNSQEEEEEEEDLHLLIIQNLDDA